jgi:protein-tyrosine-phosphatase
VGDAVASAGAALHPGLRLGPATPAATATGRILFLCTGNSARSQMAEALTVLRSDGHVQARSAGSAPKALHPEAVRVMAERGVDLSGARPKHLDELEGEPFDRVVTLCDKVKEVCPEFPGGTEAVHWSIPDPSVDGGREAFRRTADELDTRIGFLLRTLEAQ